MRRHSAALGRFGASIWAGLTAAIGGDELLLLIALACLTGGLWPALGRQALVAPGLVLLWVALPSRSAFVIRPLDKRKGD